MVAAVRRLLPRGEKVGHAGTLDPFAEGVLVLCVGAATRLAEHVQRQTKSYRAEILLGGVSSTDDITGDIEPTPDPNWPPESAMREALARFVGRISQVPPSHSAVHVNGERAYRLARAGKELSLPARDVEIYAIKLIRYEPPLLAVDVTCGTGTYIRSLARDIGRQLGIGGYCSRLCRTAVGTFRLEESVSPERLDLSRDLLDVRLGLAHLPQVTVQEAEAVRLRRGMRIELSPLVSQGEVAVFGPGGGLVAIAATIGSSLRPVKVFPNV